MKKSHTLVQNDSSSIKSALQIDTLGSKIVAIPSEASKMGACMVLKPLNYDDFLNPEETRSEIESDEDSDYPSYELGRKLT